MKNIWKIAVAVVAAAAAVLALVKYWDKINAKMQCIKKGGCKCGDEDLCCCDMPETVEEAGEAVEAVAEEVAETAGEVVEDAVEAAKEFAQDVADAITEEDFAD
ncbi:MAG: hypothetical protein HFG44_03900 [Oscillospiraceae bacterium]|nr:hypothetical protein [Oscillospiraceae bacterium]